MAMSGALARTQFLDRANAGSMSLVGSVSSVFTRTYYLVGAVTWKFLKGTVGVLSSSGALTRFVHYRRRVISKRILLETGLDLLLETGGKVYMEAAKVLTFSGSLTRSLGGYAISLAGTMGFTGALARLGSWPRSLTGSITSSGAATRLYKGLQRTAISVLSFDATIARQFVGSRAMQGVLDLAGALSRAGSRFLRSMAATLTMAGILRKRMFQTVSGALSSAGSLAVVAAYHYYRSLAGTLTSAGALARKTVFYRSIAGMIVISGTLFWQMGEFIYGVLSSVGSLVRFIHFRRSLSGEMDATGAGQRTWVKFVGALTGVLDFRGITRRSGAYVKKGLSRFGFNFDED